MKKTFQLVMASVVFFGSCASLAETNPYQIFKQDRFDIDIKAQFFKSEANFATDGSDQSLVSGNYYQILDITPRVRWGVMQDLGLYGGVNVGSAESSDPLTTRKNSTLSRVDLGVDYLLWTADMMELIADFNYSHAPEKVSRNTDLVMNSDGASEIHPKMIARFDLDWMQPFLQGGINFRTEGFSTLFTYRAGSEFRYSDLSLGVVLQGYMSIRNDENTDQAFARDTISGRVNAGSKRFFGVNPNLHELEGYLNYAFSSDLGFRTFADYTLAGANTAKGFTVGVALNWVFGDSLQAARVKHKQERRQEVSPRYEPPAQPAMSRDPNPKEFKEDTEDGVNQEYFKIVPAKKENYIQEVDEEQPTVKKTNPNEKDYKIQLKRTKPKKKKQ